MADQIITADQDCEHYCVAYFWIVPAKVAGHWQLPNGEFHLDQAFQMVNGKLTGAGQTGQLNDGKLAGNRISFAVGDTQYLGHVSGDTIDGISISSRGKDEWMATRDRGPAK